MIKIIIALLYISVTSRIKASPGDQQQDVASGSYDTVKMPIHSLNRPIFSEDDDKQSVSENEESANGVSDKKTAWVKDKLTEQDEQRQRRKSKEHKHGHRQNFNEYNEEIYEFDPRYPLRILDFSDVENQHPNKDTLFETKLSMIDKGNGLGYYILSWPNKEKNNLQLGPQGLEFRFGNQIFKQLVSLDKIILALDTITGYNLLDTVTPIVLPPDESKNFFFWVAKKTMGQIIMNLSNVRIHAATLGVQRGLDPKMKFIYDNGRYIMVDKNAIRIINKEKKLIKKQKQRLSGKRTMNPATWFRKRPKEDQEPIQFRDIPEIIHKTEQPAKYAAFIEKDHIRIEVIGLAMEVTADYEINGYSGLSHDTEVLNQEGSIYIRLLDSYLQAKIYLVQDEKFGYPTIKLKEPPIFRYAMMQVAFDREKSSAFYEKVAAFVTKRMKSVINEAVSLTLMEKLPLAADICGELIDQVLKKTLDEQLGMFPVLRNDIPYFLINDLRWMVKDSKIVTKVNLKYINQDLKSKIAHQITKIQQRNKNFTPSVIEESRQDILDSFQKWRRTNRRFVSNFLSKFLGISIGQN